VLKAIGYSEVRVMGLVLGESLLLTGFGAVLGFSFGYLLCRALAQQLTQFMPAFWLTGESLLLGAGIAIALGVISGIWPAWRAMRMRMVDALREA
jgi:putative ABC transport system permease protein